MQFLKDNKKILKNFITDVKKKEVVKISIVDDDKINVFFKNGDKEIIDIYNFLIKDSFKWFYEQGYYITMNYAPKIVLLYPKEVTTSDFKEFSKGSDLVEATINLYKWVKNV